MSHSNQQNDANPGRRLKERRSMEVKWSVLTVGHALTKDCRRKQLRKHMHTLPLSEHQQSYHAIHSVEWWYAPQQ